MPTILTHASVPLGMAWAMGGKAVPRRLLAAGILLAMLPDLDVLGFHYGIAYADALGHRGITHSLGFACAMALAICAILRPAGTSYQGRFWFLFIAIASHGLLDSFTNGGLGIALLWPFSETRFFAPWQPIAVSPIGIRHVFTDYGLSVFWSELRWVWLPMLFVAITISTVRRYFLMEATGYRPDQEIQSD